jgi:aspartate/methionine/tyrosine aminotransferase
MLRAIVDVARSCGAYLHADEVYRGLEHDQAARPPSVVHLYEKGISTGSMSKTYSLAGLRLGWLVGPRDVLETCQRHRDYTTISCGALDDRLATIALWNAEKVARRNLAIVRGNAEVLRQWIASEPRLTYVPPKAGTTVMIKYDYPLPSMEFSSRMLAETGTFVTPGECFDCEGWVRVGYACAPQTLRAGLDAFSLFLRALE